MGIELPKPIAVTPVPNVRYREFTKCGQKPLAGGEIWTYDANSTTPKITYKDPYGLTPNTNPIVLDAAGEADIFLNGTYRFVVKDRSGVIQKDISKIGSWYSGDLDDQMKSVNDLLETSAQTLMQPLADAIDTALASGAGEAGWLASLIADKNGKNQQQVNDDTNDSISTIINDTSNIYIQIKGTRNILEFIPSSKHKYLLDFSQAKNEFPDLHEIIQESFNVVESENSNIIFPFGYYFTDRTLLLPKKSRVIGSANPYILTTDNFSDLSVLSCDKGGQPEYYLDGFQLNGNSGVFLEGLRIGGCRNSVFKNIAITSCWGAGLKVHPTHEDSGDVENFELDHIWTVLSGGIKLQTNSNISRGNITDGTIANCQLTTGDNDKSTGYPIYLESSQDKMIFGVKMDRIFTQATSNNHIVIKPNNGQIFSNSFNNFSGETWKLGAGGGPSTDVKKECLYVFDGDFIDNSFNDFYRVGMQGDGIKLGVGSNGNKFDGLTFVDFMVVGSNNKWLRIPKGASHNSFKNINTRENLNASSSINAISGNTVFGGVDGKIYDLDGSNQFDGPQINSSISVLLKRAHIFELNISQLKNYPVIGCSFLATADGGVAITVPSGNELYFLEIPFEPTAAFKGSKITIMFNYTCGASMNGLALSVHICGVGRGITDYTPNKVNTMTFYADYDPENKKAIITFSGTRSADASLTLNDIVIVQGGVVPYLYTYTKNYIEN